MKFNLVERLLLMFCVFPTMVLAQEVPEIHGVHAFVQGNRVRLTIYGSDALQVACNVVVFFGDGNKSEFPVGYKGAGRFPVRISNNYSKPDAYVIKVEGRNYNKENRGCRGQASTVVRVTDIEKKKNPPSSRFPTIGISPGTLSGIPSYTKTD